MTFGSERTDAFPALRVKGDASSTAEILMASEIGMTYMDLPVCMVAEGASTYTRMDPEEVTELLGPPTHYYFRSSDKCWRLNSEEYFRLRAESLSGGGMLTRHLKFS